MPVLKFSKPKVVQHKKTNLNEDIIVAAEKSIAAVSHSEWNTLDELRLHQYFYSRKEVSIDAIMPRSMTTELSIKRANLLGNLWYKVSEPLNPLKHGYDATNLGNIRQMVKNDIHSSNFKDHSMFMPKLPPNYVRVGSNMLAICVVFYVVQLLALNSTNCNLRNLE